MIVGAVILATGTEEPEEKLLKPFNGKTVIEGVLDGLDNAGINFQVVVVGGKVEPVIEAIRPKLAKVKIALNLTPELGVTSSFQTGLIVIQGVDAAFMVSGDKPLSDPKLLLQMIKRMEENTKALIVNCSGLNVNPILFRHGLFSEIMTLDCTKNILDLIDAHVNELVTVDCVV